VNPYDELTPAAQQTIERQCWDTETVLVLALRFINGRSMGHDLTLFLRRVAEEES
jgi:hypothetical protein